MIIKRVTAKGFRAMKQEKAIDFSPGLNIIKGRDNEAGKSSLRIAITKALFQDPTTVRKDIQALTSWGTDDPWEVTLEFEVRADSYRITKSFKDKTCELAATGAHEFVAKNKNTIAEKIAELTGCPSDVFFESTACIGQDELIRIIPEGATDAERQDAVGTITKRLQAKLSGTEGVNIPAILSKLYAKTHRKDAGGPYRRLQDMTELIANLRSQKLDQERKVNDILEKRRKLSQAREELEKISQDLPAKQGLLSKNKRVLELQGEIARDRVQYGNFQRSKELKSEIDNLENELRTFSPFLNAEEKIEGLNATRGRLDMLSQQKAEFQNSLTTLEKEKPALWTLVAGVALIMGGLISLIANTYLWIASIFGLSLSAYWLIARRVWQKQVKSAIRKMGETEERLQSNEEEAERLLDGLGCKDYDNYHERLTEYRTKIEDKRDALSKLDALVAGKDWQKFAEENADLDIQMSAKLKELEQLESFKLEPLSLQKLEDEVKNLLKRKAESEQEKGALEKFFEYTDADRDQLIDTEEELRGLQQEKEFWERKKRVYDITREILEEAHKQTLSKAADLLEGEISRYIAIVTDGRYSQVKINESDLSISTFSPERNDWVDVLYLSRATQDQFYICARLALVRLVAEGKRPPILLDDPFVNFHPKRLRKMIAVLQEIAKQHQILLFTCSDAYDYLGNVVSID
jgi:uncharacterized protein YhaN